MPICLIILLSSGMCSSKNAGKVIKAVEKEWKSANESEGVRYLKTKHKVEQVQEWLDQRQYQTPCYQCSGSGVVYYIDAYGYPVERDYNGNIILHECPVCNGRGF